MYSFKVYKVYSSFIKAFIEQREYEENVVVVFVVFFFVFFVLFFLVFLLLFFLTLERSIAKGKHGDGFIQINQKYLIKYMIFKYIIKL